MSETEKRLYLILGIAVVILSFSGILIKVATAPPLIVAFYRMFLSALILTPVFFLKYNNWKIFLDYRPMLVGLLLAGHFILWITAFEYTSVASAVIFIALQPLFTLLLEFLFAREDMQEGVLIGIVMALVGSIIISYGDLELLFSRVIGDLLAVSASFFAASYLFAGRSLRKKLDYFPYLYVVYSYATLFLGIIVLVLDLPLTGYGTINYLCFIGLALGPTLVGHSLLNWSVRRVSSTVVSLAILGEPVLTTIFAWLLLNEVITFSNIIGGVFILGGIYRVTFIRSH
ncbi:DMT family transporter [Halothermothrix orenii]|uniref:Integral membrane protein DUF6 n=1 Tax=Halothermothrix orenii (strain H 168 / OCM 544 / DSM 9562) TaxID=373903 RepID=B8CY30_HALOH|nr:DMT family transporter [Halothermothrix orenii]ACL70199.1 Integral membrane protein DUF6 [Halothermothrix orenii H 168]